MPIYEYHCKECGNTFEQLHIKSNDTHMQCPECGQSADKIMSAGAFTFKNGSEAQAATCCGQANPCSSPKHCCGR